jgi:hypothetical protein
MLAEGRADNARVDRAKIEKCCRSASFLTDLATLFAEAESTATQSTRSLRFPFDLATSGRI